MTLGPRVLKTGIAVTLALYLCLYMGLEPGVFAGVAALLSIQPSIYRTWRLMLDQIITNSLGAAIALISIHFLGDSPIIIGFVAMLVIAVTLRMKMFNTIPLTLVTVLAIMSPGNENFLFSLNRFAIIMVGVGSALLVNLIILPPKYKENYLKKVHTAFENMSLLLRTAISNEMLEKTVRNESKKFKEDIQALEEQFELFDEERVKMIKLNPLDVREIVVFKQMLKTLQHGGQVLDNIEEHFFQSKTELEENRLFDHCLEQLVRSHEYLLLKYEGKMKDKEAHFEEEVLKESGLFFKQVLEFYNQDVDEKYRLLIIASSIVEYTYHLQRLNQLIEQYDKVTNKK
jgi:uncharacterized membrane protein YgaE (UPF0421/DUF939 family)